MCHEVRTVRGGLCVVKPPQRVRRQILDSNGFSYMVGVVHIHVVRRK